MKTFYGGSFMKKEDLSEAGIYHPIKLEYYRTWESINGILDDNISKYGVEVIKTEYLDNNINVENIKVNDITDEEKEINNILRLLKEHQVTPITVENVIEDLLKKEKNEEIELWD